MTRRRGGRTVAGVGLITCVLGLLGAFAPARASGTAESEGKPREQRHVVRAGWTNPDDRAEPFIYTSYFPDHLQVHRGDLVEWQFPQSYAGWHSVTFTHDGQRPVAWRDDEYPGVLAMTPEWAHGHEWGDEDVQCGRIGWQFAPDQEPCVLTAEQFDTDGEQFSSSALDRLFSVTDAGGFVAEVDLPKGTYLYFCKIHPAMEGRIEVLPGNKPLANPTEAELRARRDADFAAAKARRQELSKSSWNPVAQEWTVRVGADTTDLRVGIYDYLPGRVTVRRGDRVRFVAGTQEPNTVTFGSLPQGGFNVGGTCGPDSCSDGRGLFWGLTGAAFVWFCDPDDPGGGTPGVPMAWIPSRVADDRARGAIARGCVEVDGHAPTTVEMAAGPLMASEQRAPGNLIVDQNTFHNSGILFDETVTEAFRGKPDGTNFPHTFEARFPTAGTYTYFCIAHEFMRGQIHVI